MNNGDDAANTNAQGVVDRQRRFVADVASYTAAPPEPDPAIEREIFDDATSGLRLANSNSTDPGPFTIVNTPPSAGTAPTVAPNNNQPQTVGLSPTTVFRSSGGAELTVTPQEQPDPSRSTLHAGVPPDSKSESGSRARTSIGRAVLQHQVEIALSTALNRRHRLWAWRPAPSSTRLGIQELGGGRAPPRRAAPARNRSVCRKCRRRQGVAEGARDEVEQLRSGRSFIARRPAGDVSWSAVTAAVTASNKTRI
jgi:hypothetical protein